MPFIIPYDNYDRQENLHIETLKVTATPIPSMRVYISPGQFWYKGNHINWQGLTTDTLPKPISDYWWVVISLRMTSVTDANVAFTTGPSATNPNLPQLPLNDIPLAAVKLSILHTKILNDEIIDLRPYWAPIVATDELDSQSASDRIVETVILDSSHISSKGYNLSNRAVAGTVVVLVSGGTPQTEEANDWELARLNNSPTGQLNRRVHWGSSNLQGLLEIGDILIITYNKYQS